MALKSIAFCGPSGSGKSTLIKMLLKDYPYYFGLSISRKFSINLLSYLSNSRVFLIKSVSVNT